MEDSVQRNTVRDEAVMRRIRLLFIIVLLIYFHFEAVTAFLQLLEGSQSDRRLSDNTKLWYLLVSIIAFIFGVITLVRWFQHKTTSMFMVLWGHTVFYCAIEAYLTPAELSYSKPTLLVPLFAMAPLMSVPRTITAVALGITVLFFVLLSFDISFEWGFRRFPLESESAIARHIIWITVFVVTMVSLMMYLAFWRRAVDERNRQQATVRDFLNCVREFRLTEAHDLLEKNSNFVNSDSVVQSLRDLRMMFYAVTPFLPPGLVDPSKRRVAQEDEEEDDTDLESQDSLQRDEMSAELQHTSLKRRRCTVLVVRLSNFPTRNLRRASCIGHLFTHTAVEHVTLNDGVVDILTPCLMVATFNCHTPCAIRHPAMACKCALAISAALEEAWGSTEPEISWSMGVDTGFNLSGFCGTEIKRSEAVSGESVDMAFKLTELARQLKMTILATEAVQVEANDKVALLPVDIVEPRWLQTGRSSRIPVFEVCKKEFPRHIATGLKNAFADFLQGKLEAVLDLLNYRLPEAHEHNLSQRLVAMCTAAFHGAPLPEPYIRSEIGWNRFPGENLPGEGSTTSELFAGYITGRAHQPKAEADPDTAGLQEAITGLQEQKKATAAAEAAVEEHNDGLFSMFLAEPEEEEEVPIAVAEAEAAMPREFDDHNRSHWKRSERPCGSGAFSTVYVGLGQQGELVAMKCFKLADKHIQVADLQHEVLVLAKLSHPNIVNYVSCALTKAHFTLLMEMVSGGSLASLLKQFGALPPKVARRYMHDILKGLQYLHDQNSVHCDLKPHNALLTNEGICKLSDFGSVINTQKSTQDGETVTVRGTAVYMAPEAAAGEVSPAIDIWSIGITLIELLTGQLPWSFRGNDAQFIFALSKDERMVPTIPNSLPKDARELCQQCCQRDPKRRPTVQQILLSSFFTG